MVSVHTNPPPVQDCTPFYGFYMGLDPMGTPGMKTTEDNSFLETSSGWNATAAVEDCRKKVRKPYTITKSRESWTEQEHEKFLEALHLFDRDWKKIEAYVGSKTVIQIRSHAQKYFLKIQKNGTSEHVPPPRPKRKAAHPYPQKAPKNGPLQPSAALPEPQYNVGPDSMSMPRNPFGGVPLYPWTYNGVQTGYTSHASQDDFGSSGVTMTHNRSSNINENAPCIWISNDTNSQVKEKQCTETRVMPDFAQVYSFIGSVFDPSANDHLQRLRKMDPVNVETVLMLMKNLSVNLVSPEFLKHRRLLSRYGDSIKNDSTANKIFI